MKTASVKGPSAISVDETQKPTLESGDILVQMHACGICGSDLEKVFGEYGQPSMRLGHEPAGVVVEVGPGVTEFAKGDRVFTHHHVPCYDCHFCNHGYETMCKKYSETNLFPCGLSEEYVVPAWNVAHGGVLKISDSLSFEEAAMIEPLACCVRAWSKYSYKQGDSVAIFGVGPTGMMHAMLAQAKKFSQVFCLDVNDFRLDFAKKLGITDAIHFTDENKRQKILDATENRGVAGALQISKGAMMNLDMGKVYSKEVTLVTSYAASDSDTREALELVESGALDVKRLVTHTYPISDTQKAFEHAKSGDNAMKIIITKQTSGL